MIEAPTGPSLRIAAIDVGSNSIHMIVAQADPDGAITTLWRMKEMVGLGRISFPSHRLSDEAMEALADAIGDAAQDGNDAYWETFREQVESALSDLNS